MTADQIAPGPAATGEVKAYLRVEGSGEDALIDRLTASAAALCEEFTGQALLARSFGETMRANPAWQRLGQTPVRALTLVESVPHGLTAGVAAGAGEALLPESYAVDIDGNGDGWIRILEADGARLVRVRYTAGLASDWDGAPEALRQGIVRLAAFFYTQRDRTGEAEPPAAVTALWRPWRRMQLGGFGGRRLG